MEPCDYQRNIQSITNPETGQQEFKDPQHPLARKDGMVMLSRHLMSVCLGRWLHPGEIVIYRDGNPQNLAKRESRIDDPVETGSPLSEKFSDFALSISVGCPSKFLLLKKIGVYTTMTPAADLHRANLRLIRRNCANWFGKSLLPRSPACMVFQKRRLKNVAGHWVFPNHRVVIGPDRNVKGSPRRSRYESISITD